MVDSHYHGNHWLLMVRSPSSIFPMTPNPAPGTRAALPSTTRGLGQHFTSPKKKKNTRKTQTLVPFPGQAKKRQRLLDRLNNLLNHKVVHEPAGCETNLATAPEVSTPETETIGFMDVEEADDHEPTEHSPPMQHARVDHLFSHWKSVIPTMARPYLEYLGETLGKPLPRHASLLSACLRDCDKRSTNITCLYFDCKSSLPCEC